MTETTRSVEALRVSEEHLSATLRSIGDGVIACDGEGRVVSLNGAAETLSGWPTTEAAARALADGVSVDLANHTALIARDGTEYQIADSCSPIRDAANAVIGAVLVFRDVTEAYRRREELGESERRLLRSTERHRRNWSGKAITECDRKAFESGTGLFAIEEPITDVTGARRYLETTKIPFTTSGAEMPAILAVSMDITERERMENALNGSVARYHDLVALIPVGVYFDRGSSGEQSRTSR